ncbi:MAG: D-aminoacyl-tRNA deacylase [Candidatus Saliniplasma sp.]
MKLIVSSNEDTASMNILNNLLKYGWDELGEYEGNPVYEKDDLVSVTTNGHHIYENFLDKKVSKKFNMEFELVIVISKHASEAGINSLTVHPIGNLGEAKFGGKDGEVVPVSPHIMTNALRWLKKNYSENQKISDYQVSFEATHHGPYLETPTFYIEIGSDKERWKDKEAGSVIAKTVLDIEDPSYENFPVTICIGGGHYAPRFTDLALEKKVAIGHMVPGWGLKYLTSRTLENVVRNTNEAEFLYFDRSGTSGKERKRIKGWIDDNEKDLKLEVIRSNDLDKL